MIVDNPEIFYSIYPYKYWLIRAHILEKQLEESYDLETSNEVLYDLGIKPKDLETTIKYEIHFNLYHQLESLFELIFALEQSNHKYIWLNMADPRQNNLREIGTKIKKLANGTSNLYSKEIKIDDGRSLPFLEWLMFDTMNTDLTQEQITITIDKTSEIIKMAAQELQNKGGYNAYKHGLRILPLFKSLRIEEKENPNSYLNFDMSNCFSFLSFPKKSKKGEGFFDVIEHTEHFDIEVDITKTKIITLLMGAIIERRRLRYTGEGKIIGFVDFDLSAEIRGSNDGLKKFDLRHHFKNKE